MSENERMDRAKRIRRMREGDRAETDDEPGVDADEPRNEGDESTHNGESGSSRNGREVVETRSGAQPTEIQTSVPEQTSDEEVAQSVDTESTDEASVDGESAGTTAPLPDTDQLEDALAGGSSAGDNSGGDTAPAGPAGVTEADDSTEDKEETRVLEFSLDDEHYCLEIQYIEEIVKQEVITRVPNTPAFVEGVVDLRGQITTILNPKVTIGKENDEAGELIVVFDSEAFEDQGHIGWVVDDVRQVSPVAEDEVNDPPIEDEHVNGVIDREDSDQFVIWTSPELAFDDAES